MGLCVVKNLVSGNDSSILIHVYDFLPEQIHGEKKRIPTNRPVESPKLLLGIISAIRHRTGRATSLTSEELQRVYLQPSRETLCGSRPRLVHRTYCACLEWEFTN